MLISESIDDRYVDLEVDSKTFMIVFVDEWCKILSRLTSLGMAANLRAMFVAASNTFAYLSTFKDSLYSKDSWYELSIVSANLGSFMKREYL